MKKPTARLSLVAALLLLVVLCLLAAAGPATATTVNTVQMTLVDVLALDEPRWGDDGTMYFDNFVAYFACDRATGPDGKRFLGYVVVDLALVIPPRGDNLHTGDVVFLSEDPSDFWDANKSFSDNLAGRDLLWTGTCDGRTLNKRLHRIDAALVGWPGSVNGPYTADFEINSGNFDVANWRSGHYVGTPWNGVALVTAAP